MKLTILLGLNFILFWLMIFSLGIVVLSLGYTTADSPSLREEFIFLAFFCGHILMNFLILHLLKVMQVKFIIASLIEILLLYFVAYLMSYT